MARKHRLGDMARDFDIPFVAIWRPERKELTPVQVAIVIQEQLALGLRQLSPNSP